MSVSFWINLVVCFGALVFACFEHTEFQKAFKSATGKKRRNNAAKLVLLWVLPAGTLVATLFSARESIILENKLEPRTLTQQQKQKFIALSRDCPKVEVRLASNNPSEETIRYMEQLDGLLSAAGYQVAEKYSDCLGIHPNFVNGQSIGLMVGVPVAPNCAVSLKRCMDAVGITSSKHPWIFTNSVKAQNKGFVVRTNEIVVFVTEKQYAQ